ncbi:hypothetical protein [Bacillus sp. NPDC094106]|uniref:hypothetical protein n=1 Tax=Bacillus sp. NPDC094106 TaxID=3363949 RepID=UPI0037F2CBE7
MENKIVLSKEIAMEIEDVKESMKGKSTGIHQMDVLAVMAALLTQNKPHTKAWLNESSYNYKVLTEALVNGFEVDDKKDVKEEASEMEAEKVAIELIFTGNSIQVQFKGNPNDYQKAIQTVAKNEQILQLIAYETLSKLGKTEVEPDIETTDEKVCCMGAGACPFGGEQFLAKMLGLHQLPEELKEMEEFKELIEEIKEFHEFLKMFGHPSGELGCKDEIPKGAFEGMIPFLHMIPDSFTAPANPEGIFATMERISQVFMESQMAQTEECIELEHGDVLAVAIRGYFEDVRFIVVKDEVTGGIRLIPTNLNIPFRITKFFESEKDVIALLEEHPQVVEWGILGNTDDAKPEVA